MIAQGIVYNEQDRTMLMVRQWVQRGDIVWNFPGGGIEDNESPEEACIREIEEETGYKVRVVEQLHAEDYKYTFKAEIIGGTLFLNKDHQANGDIMEIAWISITDETKFDPYTRPFLERLALDFGGGSHEQG